MDFLQNGEDQCGERQHADPAGTSAAPNASNRRVDPEATGLSHLACNKRECPSTDTEQGRLRGPVGVADKFVQHHARAAGQVEGGAVDEANTGPAVGGGLDDVALANRIADLDLNGSAARTREGARTNRRLNMADDLGGIRGSRLGVPNMPRQRVDNIAGEMGAVGRRQRSALLALEVIRQEQFVVILGKDQVNAGSLEIAVEQQMRSGDDDRIRGGVRSGWRNSLEVAMRMRMRAWTSNGEHGIIFAGVIQSNPATVKIYLIFSKSMLAYHRKVHGETILCLCKSCKFQSAEPRRNIYCAKTRDIEVLGVDSTNKQLTWQQEIKHTDAS